MLEEEHAQCEPSTVNPCPPHRRGIKNRHRQVGGNSSECGGILSTKLGAKFVHLHGQSFQRRGSGEIEVNVEAEGLKS
jgi:hypothetical protein